MPPVMAGEDRNAGLFGRLDQPHAAGDVIRDRFLDQGRDPGGDRLQTVADMHLVGRRDDDAVGLSRGDHGLEIRVPFHASAGRRLLAGRRGIDDGIELRPRLGGDMLDMAFADQSGTENGKLDGLIHDGLIAPGVQIKMECELGSLLPNML